MTTRKTADQRQDMKPPPKKDREKDKQEKRLSNFFNAPADKSTMEISSTLTPNKLTLNKDTGEFNETELRECSEERQMITPGYLKECLDQQLEQIKIEMQGSFANLKQDILSIGQRVKVHEQKIENLEFLLQKYSETIEKQQMKINDLEERTTNIEDRGRRNNLRIRNIPESILQENLAIYLTEFFKNLKIKRKNERIHRLYKPRTLPDDLPRDVIIACHSYSFREKILKASRQTGRDQDKFKYIKVFPDLSFQTRKARKQFLPVTLRLRENNLKYRWGFPTKLIVTKDRVTHTFDSLDKVTNWLENTV
ncbi:Hypothetical predicted protein [Pelobates cultripes]|uniref:Uncharacterized protein n=1 Tax=Pelobates cultripes TaxID=61616 RepID=A0AAD1VNJ8_PELCU|nr:Hypothetical predicted protein [Pelobates cultripes]